VPIGPLDGLPLGVKDMFDTAGVRTTYGSVMFSDHLPARDADAVARLRAAGAIVIGKTQTHEFAWGISSVNEAMGTARNPWDTARIAGGSSGGSAVALAAGFVPLALGTDTGGSIRIPSAFCGTTGLKPSFGTISTRGVFPLAPSLDHVGPMARSPADVALLLDVLAPSSAGPCRAAARSDAPLAGLRIGRSTQLEGARPTAAVEAAMFTVETLIEMLGGRVSAVELPAALDRADIYLAIQRAEALTVHRRAGLYPQRASDYGPDLRRHLALAAAASPDDLERAIPARERLTRSLERVFRDVDVILTSVAPCPPPPIATETIEHDGALCALRDLVLGATVVQDLAGLPACTLRAGFDELDCPIGVQLTAAAGCEEQLLDAVEALHRASGAIQHRWPALDDRRC
jgi:aspartyl-tRNA(Asn)/glutamyl-tRNA(Gln) amidotransferase subunit A